MKSFTNDGVQYRVIEHMVSKGGGTLRAGWPDQKLEIQKKKISKSENHQNFFHKIGKKSERVFSCKIVDIVPTC